MKSVRMRKRKIVERLAHMLKKNMLDYVFSCFWIVFNEMASWILKAIIASVILDIF